MDAQILQDTDAQKLFGINIDAAVDLMACEYYTLRQDEELVKLKRLTEPDLVLPTTFDMEFLANPLLHSPPTPHAQSPLTLHAHTHTHSSPNTRINPVELGDCDWEEECEEKHDSNKGVGSPQMCVEESFVEEPQNTKIWGERCVESRESSFGQRHVSSFDIDCILVL